MKKIESLADWRILEAAMHEKGYRLFQMQFGVDRPEGFHAWFWADKKDVEVVTYNVDVKNAILKYMDK